MSSFDWNAVNDKLPSAKADEQKARLKKMVKKFCPNGKVYFLIILMSGFFSFANMSSIDWKELNKLPSDQTDHQKYYRKKMFHEFDQNGNGILTLAEVDKGTRNVIGIDCLSGAKPAIMRTYEAAKDYKESKRGRTGDDYIEFKEFQFFLIELRQNFECYVAFGIVDESGDNRISLAEFKNNQNEVEKWVGKFDAEDEFKAIDTNGGGSILFDEFCEWEMAKNLDLQDDVKECP